MADGLVQHDARPAAGQHDIEGAGRSRDGLEVDQRLPERFLGGMPPAVLDQEFAKGLASAHAIGATLLAVAIADHDRHVDADQRADVAHHLAVGTHDLDMLPGGGERGGNLAHARILGAQPGVDLLQQLCLGLEGGRGDRILVAIEMAIGAGGSRGKRAGIAALDG